MSASSARTPLRRPRSTLALLATVLLALVVGGCLGPEEQTFLDRTNALRVANGRSALQPHGTLTNKAEAWAQHMASTGTLAHSNLTSGLGGLAWKSLGENVGTSSPGGDPLLAIHNEFVSSSSHLANLLNSGYTHMGVGVAKDGAGRIWVAEVFARL